MSGFVLWIAAEAERSGGGENTRPSKPPNSSFQSRGRWQDLPAHNFTASQERGRKEEGFEADPERDQDLWMYRDRTVALLRRYVRVALETGRLPSIFGRELFRAKVSSYTAATFEDRVIFVHDVEKCLQRFDSFDQEMISRVLLQEHDHERAARLLHCTRKTIERRMPDLLDELSRELLRLRLLAPLVEMQEFKRR